jgi:hypothetical protein
MRPHLKEVLSVDAIGFHPEVITSDMGIVGIDLTGLSVGENVYQELARDRQTFLRFVGAGWERVSQAAFVEDRELNK